MDAISPHELSLSHDCESLAREAAREGWGAAMQIYTSLRQYAFAHRSMASRNVREAMTFQSTVVLARTEQQGAHRAVVPPPVPA